MSAASIETNEGTFTAVFSKDGLARLEFPGSSDTRRNRVNDDAATDPVERRWIKLTTDALNEILGGKQPKVLPPLDWSGATDFQQRVWKALLGIETGRTKTYAQVAAAAGKPRAARATGAACGANPIPVLVPCHRVVAAGGGLGGFSSGLHWKRRLLAREGVALEF